MSSSGKENPGPVSAILSELFFGGIGLALLILLLELLLGARDAWRDASIFLVAIVFGLCFRRIWPRRPALPVACLGLAFFGACCFSSLREELQEEGDKLLQSVEEFRTRTGHYPLSLEEAGCVPRSNEFGGWHYESDGQAHYLLWVGDYPKDGFILGRESGDEEWYWDT